MPDRLGDFLENSEPSRHRLACVKCGETIRGNTAIGVRFAMQRHRKTCPGKQEEVSEPPDLGDPDNVGEPEEYDAELARELAELLESGQLDELSDDMLLDRVGRGEDNRTIYDEYDEIEDPLEDDLHDIKEQPEDTPIPQLISTEEAKAIIAAAKKQYDEKKAAEGREKTQGDPDVTISDDAQRIAVIGNDETAAGAVNFAKTDLEEAMVALGRVGEALGAAVQKINLAAETVASQSAEAGTLLGGSEGAEIQGQGQTVSEQCNNANQHIMQADLGAIKASLQQTGLEGVLNQVQGLYQAIKDAASRHQG